MLRPGHLARLLWLALICLALPTEVFAAEAAPEEAPLPAIVQRPDSQALVVTLTLNRIEIGENLIVYQDGSRLLVPLGSLMAALEVAITADPETGKAFGFFIREDRRFALDLAQGTATFAGRTFAIPPGSVERQLTDLYVDSSLLSEWFSIRLFLKMEDLALLVSSIELLPVQERLERERRRSGVIRPGAPGEYEVIEPAWQWLSWPVIDTSVQYSTTRSGGQLQQQGGYTSLVTGMAGGLDYAISANGVIPSQTDQDTTLRATIGRRDPRGGLLGPLDAKEVLAGDVSSPTLPLISDSFAGRGATISTFPLHRLSDLQRVTLRGELPVGWQVELYRGGDLIDFQTSGNDGRYEFINVPTIPGLNAFKLVFYGPEGQRREEDQPVYVSAATLEAGETGFRVLFNQQNTDLLGNHPSVILEPATAFNRFDLLARNQLLSQPDVDDGKLRYIVEAEHGITDMLSVNGTLSSIPVGSVQTEYAQTGLRANLLGTLSTVDVATSSAGGIAYGPGVQGQIDSTAWLFSYERFEEFISQRSFDLILNEPLNALTTAQLTGLLPDLGLGRAPFATSATLGEVRNGDSHLELSARVSNYIDRFTVSAETQAHVISHQPTQSDEVFRVGTQFGKLGLRGEAIYDLTPSGELAAVQVTGDYALRPDLNVRAGITQLQTRPQETQLTTGVAVLLNQLQVGTDLEVSNRGDFTALLKLSFSFGMEPRTGTPTFRGENIAGTGIVAPMAFLDRNGDGVFGPGDVPLPNVRFTGGGVPFRGQTDQTGTALITGLEPYRETPVAIDVESLNDPFWRPADQKIAVLSRPGSVVPLQFPVYETGAIDGIIELNRDGQRVALPGIRVQAFDANGKVAVQTLSGYDGSFFLEGVRLGRYLIRADPDQLARLHLVAPEPRSVALALDKPTISIGTIGLSREPAPKATGDARATRAAVPEAKNQN
jgi:hypothetical protein